MKTHKKSEKVTTIRSLKEDSQDSLSTSGGGTPHE